MEFAIPRALPDYSPADQKFRAAQANSGRVPATAEQIAEGIYEAATDGKPQLRYPLGDAAQTLHMRTTVGDEAFVAGIRQRIFG
jgi:hypothetical protein